MEMTSRERMMTAMRGGTPDRVPAAPDISNMIPCRLTGKPFYEIYANRNPPLEDAYLNALDQLGIDGWYTYGALCYHYPVRVESRREWLQQTAERWTCRDVTATPAGELSAVTVFPAGDPPTVTEKQLKRFPEDFEKYKYLLQCPDAVDDSCFQEQKRRLGERGIMAVGIAPPGLHVFCTCFDGNLEAAAYAYYDYPAVFEEWRELAERQALRQLELALSCGVDSILTGGSGSITLQSPEIWRQLSLPTIQKITRMCREAGVICGIHSCGKEWCLLEACHDETELSYVNPLEIPPMGDCTLKAASERFSDRLCLMGNLHTTEVMLRGSRELVRLRSLEAIRDAGLRGRFVLSTGDQCGRDTPLENIREMVRVAEEFGRYPIDGDRLSGEIARLEKCCGIDG